ncbi:hypothetical protein ACQPXS_01300 [Streptomyces sp. CA-142005]|uniref:hypothetical protein n=1 Tax=Streptomyces sp. CA-142005 TaxID=3240052 RepID=UPI003D8B98FC
MTASIEKARTHVELYVLPSPSPVEILSFDFRQMAHLMQAATDSTNRWLDQGRHIDPTTGSERNAPTRPTAGPSPEAAR